MDKRRTGAFFVIEGTDGSGKSEQFRRLVSRLRRNRIPAATFDFPQYGKSSSYFVREYLNGRYGTWQEVGPRKASLFFAMDRFDVGEKIKKWLKAGKVVISNRYVASNMGHQGAKLHSRAERLKFLRWVYELEYGFLGIPKPDLNVVLHVPAGIAQKLVDRKGRREYLGGARRDIHEADLRHLERAERTYLEMAKLFPKDFKLIRCVEGGKLLSMERIEERLWSVIGPLVRRRMNARAK